MRIGIVGAGAMAWALGGGWAAAGHEIRVGTRSPERAAELAARIGHGARAGSIRAAAEFGEAVLLAVPVAALDAVLAETGALAGRTVIDCTNAFQPDEGGFVLSEPAVAERISAARPGAKVVKAFNLCAAEVWASGQPREFDGRPLSVPLCGDDGDAVDLVARLAADLGVRPFRAGGLRRARYLEATAAFIVGLWFAGDDARAMFPPVTAAFAHPDGI
ncbi:NAD(P)-binding domain-containing protein [Nocardia sp. CDC159]|uniref:NAD(P)-binding domain-containing protein n=1 Tax=Nocardia pulmonis TaxID=2951408 RepID=A0A9X2E800_9NOCA|nr:MULTISPECIES: NAD(P)-binding domain-containing protein [Nocardia]MCM6774858.1 NAD(P)-binding domain-containing protein [Nocardia pulmonis]MCM6789789.1 NAD(P)-binding domain-containing protein [Nocardia sp. CDC159]